MRITRRSAALLAAGAAAALAAAAGGAALAGDGDDEPLRGGAYDRAVAAALAATGGGEVTETEIGDDGAAYEVEVRRADGSQVEVELDGNFVVIAQELDDDDAEDD